MDTLGTVAKFVKKWQVAFITYLLHYFAASKKSGFQELDSPV